MASIRIAAPITAQWARANAKAAANAKLGLRAERIAERTYRVKSASGAEAHVVTVGSIINLEARCTCPAGTNGLICWHASAAIAAAVQRCAAKATPVAAPEAALAAAENQAKMDRFSRV